MAPKQKNSEVWVRVGVTALVVIAACLLVYGLLIIDYLFFTPSKDFKSALVPKSQSQLSAEQREALIQSTSAPNQSRLSPDQEAAVVRSTTAKNNNLLSADEQQKLIKSMSAPN